MGRPLNKKYFGNRNIGTNGGYTADDGIGGEGVASTAINAAGSYTTRPTFAYSAPALPNGVTATGTITSEALSAVATAAGNGYNVGDLLVVTTAGGTATAYVATLTGAAGSGVATVNFTGTGASRGSFEALPSGAQATVSTPGAGATLTITFRAKAVIVTNKGSGYIASPTVSGLSGSVTLNAITLTVDTGNVGSATNQENTILMTAQLPGGSAGLVDILRQVSTNRYKVTDGTRTGIVKLKAGSTSADGECDVTATDYNSNTYNVTKITAHRALLTQVAGGSNYVFATGDSATWTFAAAVGTDKTVAGTTVSLNNA